VSGVLRIESTEPEKNFKRDSLGQYFAIDVYYLQVDVRQIFFAGRISD